MSHIYHKSKTFLEVILETTALLEKYKTDAAVTKEDVIESMEDQLSYICGKLVSAPTNTSFVLFKTNNE
jgi:hypothetical protein